VSPVVATPPEDAPASLAAMAAAIHHHHHQPPLPQDPPIWPPGSLTLQEQMQHAYALDDMHLARVLFLKLRGIEVASDDDPRIAAVCDDDFQPCFVPPGAIALDEEDEKKMRDRRRKEEERWRTRAREERLRELGRRWEDERAKMKAMRERAVARKAKEEETRRRAEERDRERRASARARRRDTQAGVDARTEETMRRHLQLGIGCSTGRPKISYTSLSPTRACAPAKEEPYTLRYDLPPLPSLACVGSPPSTSRSPPSSSKPKPRPAMATTPPSSPHRSPSIPFELVITCMSGPLFPVEDLSLVPAPRPRATAAQKLLLDSLCRPADHAADAKLRAKGKQPVRRTDSMLSAASTDSDCPACSAGTARPSTVSSASTSTSTSRSGSWLSFGSHMSVSTAITSPAASLRSKASSVSSSSSPSTSPKTQCASLLATHTCSCPRTRLTRVPLAECPLDFERETERCKHAPAPDEEAAPAKGPGGGGPALSFKERVSLSVSRVVDFAARLQDAYVRATLSNAMAYDAYDARPFPARGPGARPSTAFRQALKPPGYRVRAADIHAFLAAPAPDAPADGGDDGDGVPPALYLLFPLSLGPAPAPAPPAPPARSALGPGFPPLPSPLRPRAPPPTLSYRPRPIANPALLRLRALQNVCGARALAWEGRAREGGMGAGRERLVGVAFEGIGRSRLARQVYLDIEIDVEVVEVEY
jgi:hypothetical protein